MKPNPRRPNELTYSCRTASLATQLLTQTFTLRQRPDHQQRYEPRDRLDVSLSAEDIGPTAHECCGVFWQLPNLHEGRPERVGHESKVGVGSQQTEGLSSTLVALTWERPASDRARRQARPIGDQSWMRVTDCSGCVQEKRVVGSGDQGAVYAEVARQTGRDDVEAVNTLGGGPVPRRQLRIAPRRRVGSWELP